MSREEGDRVERDVERERQSRDRQREYRVENDKENRE